MKLINFSFKREPVWMLVFSLAPAVGGLLVLVVLLVLRSLR
jgi:hypothetical protein